MQLSGVPHAPPRSRVEEVVEWLTSEIVNGRLRPGQWISENEVAAAAGVSRSPVREALKRLQADGLVEVVPRRGHVIVELDAVDADHLYKARALVEGEAVRLAVPALDDADVEELESIFAGMQRAREQPRRYFELNVGFHERLMAACPNGVIVELTHSLLRRSIRFRSLALRLPGQIEMSISVHHALLEACRSRDADRAKQAMEMLLDNSRCALLDRLFLDVDGRSIARPRVG